MTASSDLWTVARVLAWAADDFRARGIESPRLDAELLLAHTLSCDRIRLVIDSQRPLTADELSTFKSYIQRRRRYEPVAYLIGRREFWGRDFHVDRRVLVPRPDTEILVEAALEYTEQQHLFGQALDLCTGSGCVAITFALARPTWRTWAGDVSSDALTVARENALRLGANGVVFRQGNLFEAAPAGERFDLITANAPYIAAQELPSLQPDVRDHEPHLALLGGDDGLDLVRALIDAAPDYLTDAGALVLEVGAGQAAKARALMQERGLREVEARQDLAGHERVVVGLNGRD